MPRRLAALAAALALATLPPAAGAQIVQNGGFEDDPGDCTGSFSTLGTGSTLLSPWAITGGAVDWICTAWQDDEGIRSLDLNATVAGTISQTVVLTPGATYQLSFAMAGNTAGGPTIKTIEALVGTVLTELFDFDVTGHSPGSMGWQTFNRNFVANEANTLLQFRSTIDGAFGPALDDVSITFVSGAVVPEPATVLLVGGGLAALAAAARRRRA
jgi:choice-of-anchor C domain-containing protein